MIWNSWADFFHMGGYGLYVWGSFVVTVVLIVGEVVLLRRRSERAFKRARLAAELGKERSYESET